MASDPDATLILYGSNVNGNFSELSGIDLLVLLNKEKVTHNDWIKITYPLYDIQFSTGVLISPFVFSKKVWHTGKGITPFYETVSREGTVL